MMSSQLWTSAFVVISVSMCCMVRGEGLPDANTASTSTAPLKDVTAASAPSLDIGDKPPACSDKTWATVKTMLPKYPMTLKWPTEGVVIARMAESPVTMFSSAEWTRTKADDSASHNGRRMLVSLATTRPAVQHETDKYVVSIRIEQVEGSHNAMKAAMCTSAWMMSAARGSTWHGFNVAKVPSASFIANLADGPRNKMVCSIGNLCVTLNVSDESREKFPDISTLGKLSDKLGLLMVPKAPDGQPAKPSQIRITVGDAVKNVIAMTVETPKEGGCEGWWLRMDTTSGRLIVESPSKVSLLGVNTKGATVTCYAISPDSKEWYSTSVEIPGRLAASQPATKPNE